MAVAETYGLMARVVTSITASATLPASARTDYVYLCGAALTATLPTAVGNKNTYTIKQTTAGAVTITPTGGQTIDGAASLATSALNQTVRLISNGADWVVI